MASVPTNQQEDDIVGDLIRQQSSVEEAAKSCGGQYDVRFELPVKCGGHAFLRRSYASFY